MTSPLLLTVLLYRIKYHKKIIQSFILIEVESAEGKGSRFDIILPLTSKKQKVKRTLFF